jgi:hypothetical protein
MALVNATTKTKMKRILRSLDLALDDLEQIITTESYENLDSVAYTLQELQNEVLEYYRHDFAQRV